MKKEIIILVGNIGSGKSTLAKKYQEKGYVVISRDGIRYSIGGGNYIFNTKYESIIWEVELNMLECFMAINANIVVDEVGVSKSMRLRYIIPAQDYEYTIKCHLLNKLTMKESVERRMQDPHGQYDRALWKTVWHKFNKIYEDPKLDEGFSEIIKTII